MKNNTANTTAVSVSGDLFHKIMTPADFSALDELITALGDRAADLAPEEKESAVNVITEWNDSVIKRIEYNVGQARNVLDFLSGRPMYGEASLQMIELFHEILGDSDEYDAVQDASDNYMQVQGEMPLEEPVDGAMTVDEADRVAMQNRAATVAYDRKLRSAEHLYNKAVKAYIKSVNETPEAKALYKRLTDYKRKANRMMADCKDKASRAKLNISISDPDTRALLHEMLDFTKTV